MIILDTYQTLFECQQNLKCVISKPLTAMAATLKNLF